MTFDLPARPNRPIDGRLLSDEQVIGLTKAQIIWCDLTEKQLDLRTAHFDKHPMVLPPSEARPDRIPGPEEQEMIRRLFEWVDGMHEFVRKPRGMSWIEIHGMLASLTRLLEWANSNPPIDPLYRYRVDAPMDPDAQVPDHIPEGWES